MVTGYLAESVLGKAVAAGAFQVAVHDPREHGIGRHRQTDDYPFGGGQGMVMRPEPVVHTLEQVPRGERPRVVLLDPAGRRFDQATARRFAALTDLILVCGRYEGVDERIRAHVDEEVSLGDFVMTGGELAALAVIDATARLLPGVLGNEASHAEESFEGGLLEFPQYTRPRQFRGQGVPTVLLSGDHARIRQWRLVQAVQRTRERRPDLLERTPLSQEARVLLQRLARELDPRTAGEATPSSEGRDGPPGGGAPPRSD